MIQWTPVYRSPGFLYTGSPCFEVASQRAGVSRELPVVPMRTTRTASTLRYNHAASSKLDRAEYVRLSSHPGLLFKFIGEPESLNFRFLSCLNASDLTILLSSRRDASNFGWRHDCLVHVKSVALEDVDRGISINDNGDM